MVFHIFNEGNVQEIMQPMSREISAAAAASWATHQKFLLAWHGSREISAAASWATCYWHPFLEQLAFGLACNMVVKGEGFTA